VSVSVPFEAFGHKNVKSIHRTTLEITSENFLTESGDCILAIRSTLVPSLLPKAAKDLIRSGARVSLEISAGHYVDSVRGWGSSNLDLNSNRALIFRKSSFASPETVAIKCDKAAKDLDRRLIEVVKSGVKVSFTLKISLK